MQRVNECERIWEKENIIKKTEDNDLILHINFWCSKLTGKQEVRKEFPKQELQEKLFDLAISKMKK